MSHGPLPLVPILVLPKVVADELVASGIGEPSRNPFGEFSAGDWWMGLLMVTNEASVAITLLQGAKSVSQVAERLHQWITGDSCKAASIEGNGHRSQLSYRSTRGTGQLFLDEKPTLEELTEWLVATYSILEGDAETR